jgi:hypothetical protein
MGGYSIVLQSTAKDLGLHTSTKKEVFLPWFLHGTTFDSYPEINCIQSSTVDVAT